MWYMKMQSENYLAVNSELEKWKMRIWKKILDYYNS